MELGETLVEAAERETMEEAGLSGRLGMRVADVRDAKAHTVMFTMHVLAEHDDWDERGRGRQWFDLGVPCARRDSNPQPVLPLHRARGKASS